MKTVFDAPVMPTLAELGPKKKLIPKTIHTIFGSTSGKSQYIIDGAFFGAENRNNYKLGDPIKIENKPTPRAKPGRTEFTHLYRGDSGYVFPAK